MPFNFPRVSCMILIILISLISVEAHPQEKVMDVKEELKYELFRFYKTGLHEISLSIPVRAEKKQFIIQTEIKTYPEVPFIEFNQILNQKWNLMTTSYIQENISDQASRTNPFQEPNTNSIIKGSIKINVETNGNVEKDISVPIEDGTKYRDRLSWIYESRINSFSNKNFNIPVFANDSISSVRYSFNANKTVVNTETFDYDISVIKLEGITDFTGIFGFKGEFLILLSDDEYRVPIKAYFNSSLGNVTCELISYKKDLWKPPAFKK
ncbi:MAG: DUF3108 domain-containing protein [Ignavibacteria bacterium]